MAIVRLEQFALAIALMAGPLTDAAASPPPPPPSYVQAVATLLTHEEDAGTMAKLSNFVADDVRAYVNDQLIAAGKADWTRHYASTQARRAGLFGYSEGWKNGGSLMIVDQFDTVDRSSLPSGMAADPRYATRTTLYQFAPDGKIHEIHVVMSDGFWIRP